MKKIIIYGAGGLGKEIALVIENINQVGGIWDFLGFVDDKIKKGTEIYAGYKVMGSKKIFAELREDVYVICAVGDGKVRQSIYQIILQNNYVLIPTIVDASVNLGKNITIGKGSIVCKGSSLTVDTEIGEGVLINVGALVGHDSSIGDYSTLSPRAMIAGNTKIGQRCTLGAGSFVLEGIKITDDTKIAPLSGVYRNIDKPGVYSGNPARQIR